MTAAGNDLSFESILKRGDEKMNCEENHNEEGQMWVVYVFDTRVYSVFSNTIGHTIRGFDNIDIFDKWCRLSPQLHCYLHG